MKKTTLPTNGGNARRELTQLACNAMQAHHLETGFSSAALQQLAAISAATPPDEAALRDIRDLRDLPWCSIDNDDSRDLDQLTVLTPLGDNLRLYVAIADVDALVPKDSPLDLQARANSATVYTSACIFPMLPERLSTDLTSLNPGVDRLALVTQMDFSANGQLLGASVYRARVHNHAQLAYDAVALWLTGDGPLPAAAQAVPEMAFQLRAQDALAQSLRALRHTNGSLEFETFAPRAVFDGDRVVNIVQQVQNRARQLIEEIMVAANGCNARFLAHAGHGSLRRVVRSPERWQRIVDFASQFGTALPAQPDARALEAFLAERHAADPVHFPDVSLVIVKLMGSGVYQVEAPGDVAVGHFGLAVRDYTHSTAPNRRYPDLVTARLIKAVLAGLPPPYSVAELATLAAHCTRQEDAIRKVERSLRKSEAALLLQHQIGSVFDGVITGNAIDGLWVRLFTPPVEGRLHAARARAVGDLVRVRLLSTDFARGYIDFQLLD